ncbi:MAG TPA: BON domain-containing protein, partial [Blastocatellia bacterium]|nr:BON domain-containing protein [Blastocatellia bacterium]
MIRSFLTLMVMGLLLFSLACDSANNANQSATANRPANANREMADTGMSDSWITAKTKLAMIADSRTSGFETEVDTKGGLVTLSGKVDTAEAKTAAEEV